MSANRYLLKAPQKENLQNCEENHHQQLWHVLGRCPGETMCARLVSKHRTWLAACATLSGVLTNSRRYVYIFFWLLFFPLVCFRCFLFVFGVVLLACLSSCLFFCMFACWFAVCLVVMSWLCGFPFVLVCLFVVCFPFCVPVWVLFLPSYSSTFYASAVFKYCTTWAEMTCA